MKSGLQRTLRPTGVGAVLVDLAPFGMLAGRHIIDPGGEINRGVDARFLGGVILPAKEIEAQMRMGFADGCRMIAPAMMALREERNRVNGCSLQCLLPAFLVELLTDAGNVRRSVKIEVDLAETEWMHCRLHETGFGFTFEMLPQKTSLRR